ncbi:MAG: hypothetical protein PGN25_00425 [Methylorubrum populi]
MSSFPRPLAALAALALLGAEPTIARADPGQIKGQDVMGDKSRSANDGWSQAPVPREESAAKDAPDPGGRSTERNKDRPVPKAGEGGGDGTDPQQPLDHRTPGPSGHNPAQPTK